MGSIVAQRVCANTRMVAGIVLCATTDRRSTVAERLFHQGMETTMLAARGLSRSRTTARARAAGRATDNRSLGIQPTDIHDWAVEGFRSTSPWAVLSGRRSVATAPTLAGPDRRADRRGRDLRDKVLPASRRSRARPDPRRDHPRHRRRSRLTA